MLGYQEKSERIKTERERCLRSHPFYFPIELQPFSPFLHQIDILRLFCPSENFSAKKSRLNEEGTIGQAYALGINFE